MKFICVCKFCGEHTSDEASIELNFRDSMIYFFCFKCKKENKIELKPPNQPLPRIGIRR